MAKVTGMGGVFFRARDPAALSRWYRERLGVPLGEEGYGDFEWRERDDPERVGRTVFSLFPDDTDYFGPDPAAFMVNFRVDDLEALLEELREAGVEVADEVEEHPYGKFGWITDPEGRRIELWEPVDPREPLSPDPA